MGGGHRAPCPLPQAQPPPLTFQRQKLMRARRSSPPRMLPTSTQSETGTRFPWMISSTICGSTKKGPGEGNGAGGVPTPPAWGGVGGSYLPALCPLLQHQHAAPWDPQPGRGDHLHAPERHLGVAKGGSRRVPPEPGGGGGGGPAAPSSPRGRSRCGGSAGRGRPPLRRGPGGPAGSSAPGTRRCHSPMGTERGGLWQGTPPPAPAGGCRGAAHQPVCMQELRGVHGEHCGCAPLPPLLGGVFQGAGGLGEERSWGGRRDGGRRDTPPGPPAGEGGSRCQPGRV